MGRPALGDAERARVRALVELERARQGVGAGWRPIYAVLVDIEPEVSRMLVEEALRAIKAGERAAAAAVAEAARQGVEVLARDTVWAADATHLGRLEDGQACLGEHVRDRATHALHSAHLARDSR